MKNTTYKTLAASFMLVTVFMVIHTAHAQDNEPMMPAGANAPMQAGAPTDGQGFFARIFHRGDAPAPTIGASMNTDATASAPAGRGMGPRPMTGMKSADSLAMGTVTAVNGTTVTMTGLDSTTFTVDASSATISKGLGAESTAGTISDIAVGDRIAVAGTHTGTSIAATKVIYGLNGAMMKAAGTMMGDKPGMIGTVASVSGTTITITGKDGTTYTVDASGATLTKGMGPDAKTIAITDIATGDTVGVAGTFSGTTVTATKVIDGVSLDMKGAIAAAGWQKPAISGSVTAVSGTTITVAGKDGTVYTVDASAATFVKGEADSGSATTIAGISVGDTIAVEGTLSGASVAATKVIDGVRPMGKDMLQGGDSVASGSASHPVSTILQKIGTFFGHLKFW